MQAKSGLAAAGNHLSLVADTLRISRLAREQQAQILFDQIVDIADTPKEGATVITRGGRRETRVGDMTEHRRLQIEARKWVLSKLLPKKYGDRIEVAQSEDPLMQLLDEMRNESKRLGPPEGQ